MQDRTQHKIGQQGRDEADKAQQVINFPNSRSSNCFINSDEKIDGTYSQAFYENNNLISRNTSQIGLKDYNIEWCIENVNDFNNIFTVEIFGEVAPFTATVQKKNYIDPNDLIDAVITALNLAVGAVATFTKTPSVQFETCLITLTCTKTFRFISPSTGISAGFSTYGIPFTNTLSNNYKIIPTLQYTKYIDVLITEIKQSQFTSDTFTGVQRFSSNDHIARIFVDTSLAIPRNIAAEYSNVDYFGFTHRALTSFVCTLYDEYQNILFSDTFLSGTDNIEIPYVKYNFTLNIIS